ncbi:hypothetical protein [Agromyces bauzanensis]|uniref:Uncharacterized protein n=1 Tax=Agromyces bauzanensis TaxID=1308924 RepID=A0A917US88_9MICO|nr:hypothetical protein [Agromyces bauzanensis]GGJ81246.1 hypothetical protein GCM10011372_19550 [Agromyces bauzanensis]
MQKVLLLGLGVTAALVAAVFVGAAAATTGAPVFYDARYPAPVTTGPDVYDVEAHDADVPAAGAPVDDAGQAVADGTVPDAPGASAGPTPPTAPPASSPPTTPGPDDEPSEDEPSDEIDSESGAPVTAPTPDEQKRWLAFQQVVRDCMADAGQEYLYWEWWNPGADTSNRFPAMPADLTPDELAAWQLALNGDTGTGDDYRWQDAGCWGRAVQITGGKR